MIRNIHKSSDPKIVLSVFLICLITSGNLTAQQDSLRLQSAVSDTSIKTAIQPDSIQTIKTRERSRVFEISPVWRSLDRKLLLSNETSKWAIFDFNKIILQNYNGAADVFRTCSAYQIFDFMEMGQPRYVTALGLLPHQTAVQMDGHGMSDPIHGMYNTRFISLDEAQIVEADPITAGNSGGISNHLTGFSVASRIVTPDEPYTRLMYRAGDFGYTDLDIDFAHCLNKQMTVQLGGVSKYYDPTAYRGVQYRVAFNYQIAENIFSRTRLNMNRERTWSRNFSEFPLYHYGESRDDLISDLTWFTDSTRSGNWRFSAEVLRTRRTNRFAADKFHLRYRFDRYLLSVERTLTFQGLDLSGGVNVFQNKVWGGSFKRDYVDSGADGFVRLDYLVNHSLRLKPALGINYGYGQNILLHPAVEAEYEFSKLKARGSISRKSRAPFRNERSFQHNAFSGNRNLKNERMTSILAAIQYSPFTFLNLNIEGGQRRLEDEIVFDGKTFDNGAERHVSYLAGTGQVRFWWFTFSGGGQINSSSAQISPKKSGWLQLTYHDAWLNGKVIIDAVGNVYWYDRHQRLYYNPVVERFYLGAGESPGYYTYTYKLAATVKDAQFFLAMDNPFSYQYSFVTGYYEFYRRLQFGVNWVLWD